MAVNSRSVLLSRLVWVIFLLLYCVPLALVPRFEEMFHAFGADLPTITKLIVSYYYYYPVILFVAWFAALIKGGQNSLTSTIKLNAITYGVVAVITLVGLYLPVFSMAKVV